ncbi:MAG: hypothetical protein NZ578_15060, partial [Candidatus Binatia bacterium]|nr:hypothetical protein [Candidatus Binatia bacterium]
MLAAWLSSLPALNALRRCGDQADPPQLLAERIRLLYTNSPLAVLASLANGVIVTAVLWPVVDQTRLLVWLGTLTLVTCGRMWLVWWYCR